MNQLKFLNKGLKILIKSYEQKIKGVKEYKGSAEVICKRIIRDCWNGEYFMTSAGHFTEFWTRDFGWCSEALVSKGYKSKVKKTLEYALNKFREGGRVTTTINDKGELSDFPYYAVDSLPWLLRALKACKAKRLINEYEEFINNEVNKFTKLVINKRTGLARKGPFSSIKDYSIRNSSTYDNVMVAMLKNDLKDLGLNNSLHKLSIKKNIMKRLWNGRYFKNDLNDNEITSDANIFPFSTGVFNDDRMLKSCMNAIIEQGLDEPLPVKYSTNDLKNHIMAYELIKNYQGTSVWTHMGPLFIKLMKKVNPEKAREYKEKYKQLIEKYHNYLEVLNNDLTPFETGFYISDEGMLWAINYLNL